MRDETLPPVTDPRWPCLFLQQAARSQAEVLDGFIEAVMHQQRTPSRREIVASVKLNQELVHDQLRRMLAYATTINPDGGRA